jgi:hypothetical protein
MIDRIFPETPRPGVIVSTYGTSAYVHLHLAAWKTYYPQVPLLVFDDGSPDFQQLAALCKHDGADFVANTVRLGHKRGDMSSFVQGLLWASSRDIDLLVKFSRRWVCLQDWRPSLLEVASESQYATYSNECRHWNYGFRTECIALHVGSWLGQVEEMRRLISEDRIGLPEADLHQMSRNIHEAGVCRVNDAHLRQHPRSPEKNAYGIWSVLGTSRRDKQEKVLWHETHSPAEYLQALQSLDAFNYTVEDFKVP